jgi:hypothetical protein
MIFIQIDSIDDTKVIDLICTRSTLIFQLETNHHTKTETQNTPHKDTGKQNTSHYDMNEIKTNNVTL